MAAAMVDWVAYLAAGEFLTLADETLHDAPSGYGSL